MNAFRDRISDPPRTSENIVYKECDLSDSETSSVA